MTTQTTPKEVQLILNENKTVLDWIKGWQSKNEYNPRFLDEHNNKFNAEFNYFLNNGNFSEDTVNLFTN